MPSWQLSRISVEELREKGIEKKLVRDEFRLKIPVRKLKVESACKEELRAILHKFISLFHPLIVNYKSALNTNPTSFGIKDSVAIFSHFSLLFSFLLVLHFNGWLDRCLPRAVAQSVNNLQQKLHIYAHIYTY